MRNRFTNLGWTVTIAVAIVPVLLWLLTQPTQWDTAKLIVENLGKLAGLAGLALFAWSVILSARLKIFGRLFMGLDNMYRAHHIIGCLAIILLLIHPMLLTERYLLSSPISAYEFLKPSFESPYRFLGEFTLTIFVALMIIVLYVKISQRRLITIMRLMGVLVFLGGIHAIFVGGSDVNALPLLQIYILSLLFVAAVVYLYRSIFHKSFAKFYNFSVSAIQHKGDIIELHMSPKDKMIDYLPGQFAFIKLEASGLLGESHPFTISQSPGTNQLRFSIKQLGDYTNALSEVKKGQSVKIDAPYGSFSNKVVTAKRQIWVAGGIGITPFLAMAGALESGQQIDLYYSLKTKAEAVYLDELQTAAAAHSNLRLLPHFSDQSGFLTADTIYAQSKSLDNAVFMVCGPPPMMKALRAQLRSRGVANKHIHTEEFSLL
jgi:predicted ferric reductase